jgi:dUTP pyrophosphatase
MELQVKKLYKHSKLPTRGTPGSAGLDLYSTQSVIIQPDTSEVVGLGVSMKIPEGYFGLLTLRSKIGFKLDSMCHVGIIDSDFRDELKIKIFCENPYGVHIKAGDKIAQLTLVPYPIVDVVEVKELDETTRTGGFGSTDLIVDEII